MSFDIDSLATFALNCGLERDKGYSCDKPEQINFYYEKRLGVCQPMMFHGCGGNENRFTSATECMDKCKYKREQMEVDANNSSLNISVTYPHHQVEKQSLTSTTVDMYINQA
uniref:BPTI/Kunitz inhibitor domain-containing protein n=1 Tax=Heterorhabditis bacteriophora TaxID=37862 RepID=A0A1I7XJJ0_HETBA